MSEDDPIEALLKATGRRPTVPAERTRRVRDAASASFRQELARRTRRRRLRLIVPLTAAAVIVTVLLGVRTYRSATAPEPSGVRVERVANVAWARYGSLPILRFDRKLLAGSIVPRDSEVSTAADALVALLAPSGHSLRLDSGTTLRVRSDRSFELERGAVYVDSHGSGALGKDSIRIATPVGTIEDRGTQFEARWDRGALSVRVREGVVTIQSASGPLEAREREALRLDASGRVERTEELANGGGWRWAETIAPMIEIEGRSLIDFLNWVARERGVRLQFADPGLAGRAPGILLKGSIAGMSFDQATTSVLTACGLSHRWSGDTLFVGADRADPRAP